MHRQPPVCEACIEVDRLERGYQAAVNTALVARADYLTLLETEAADATELRRLRGRWECMEATRQQIAGQLDALALRRERPPAQPAGFATSSRR